MNRHRRSSRFIRVALALLVLSACASMAPPQFFNATPRFDPVAYFTGPTRSWGVIENRSGDPESRFRTSMTGKPDGNGITITQDFSFEDGHTQQRIWHLKRVDQHRYDATASDVIGIATGYAYGNSFNWDYTLRLKAGNPFSRVHMHHWMYLTDDGDLVINRVVISKFGVIVAQTTEYFRRGAGTVPTIAAPR